MKKRFLVSTKHPGLEFEILSVDKESKQAELIGATGVVFTKFLTAEVMEKYGYKLEKRDEKEE